MEGTPWGGSEELWSRTAAVLAQQGVTVGVNVQGWPQPVRQVEELRGKGCHVYVRRPPSAGRLPVRVARRLQRMLTKPPHWLDEFRPDLVVLSQGHHVAGLDWMQECAQRGISYAAVTQSASEIWWPEDSYLLPWAQALQQAAKCFFVSYGNQKLVERQIAARLPNAQVVRNPFNVAYDAAPPWLGTADGYQLACVGRLEPLPKGQDILFEVLAQDKWKSRSLSVTLYGNGPNRESLMRLKQKYRLDNVHFGGFTADVESIWAAHHALVLPSRFEGLPLAEVEAMLCGRVPIVTDVAGNAELLTDNVSGFVAAAPTVPALDEALERAWQKRTMWQQMGQDAARQVRTLVPPDPVAVFAREVLALL